MFEATISSPFQQHFQRNQGTGMKDWGLAKKTHAGSFTDTLPLFNFPQVPRSTFDSLPTDQKRTHWLCLMGMNCSESPPPGDWASLLTPEGIWEAAYLGTRLESQAREQNKLGQINNFGLLVGSPGLSLRWQWDCGFTAWYKSTQKKLFSFLPPGLDNLCLFLQIWTEPTRDALVLQQSRLD